MELLFNVRWLSMAELAIQRRFRFFRSSRPQRLGRFHHLIARGCLVALLFPVLFTSDNLQLEKSRSEDSRDSQGSSKCFDRDDVGNDSSKAPSLVAGLPQDFFGPERHSVLGCVVPAPICEPAVLSTPVSPSRSPPVHLTLT